MYPNGLIPTIPYAMKTSLLKELLDLGDAFEQQAPDPAGQTVAHFLAWAEANGHAAGPPPPVAAEQYYTAAIPLLPTIIAQYLTIAARHFRHYVKKALTTVPLLSFDDFISLVYLAERGQMTKTELVEATLNEKSSGLLVIKRLTAQGFVAESDDAQDRRSRRLTLTPAGYAVLGAVQPAMNQASQLLTGDLSAAEQQQLGTLLVRLDTFHQPLYRHQRDASLTELHAVALPPTPTLP